MSKSIKILTFTTLFILMLATTIWASLQQNLFTEFDWSNSPMWFKATLIDFYINQFILWLGVVALEKKHTQKALWLVLFFCFGSMGTCLYVLQKIVTNKSILNKE